MEKSAYAFIALGANLPCGTSLPPQTLREAMHEMVKEGLTVLALSRLFQTPCFPPGAGPDYTNAAAVLDCSQLPDSGAVLQRLHKIEARFGRKREQRWGMRTLDLDLLALGDSVLPDAETQDRWRNLPAAEQIGSAPDQLILPHPRLQDRAFVLVPLAEVAPDWRHPRTGQSVRQMLNALPEADRAAVKPL